MTTDETANRSSGILSEGDTRDHLRIKDEQIAGLRTKVDSARAGIVSVERAIGRRNAQVGAMGQQIERLKAKIIELRITNGYEARNDGGPTLPPPAEKGSWLHWAVANMETRSLYLEWCADERPEWQGVTLHREDMRRAARAELEALLAERNKPETGDEG